MTQLYPQADRLATSEKYGGRNQANIKPCPSASKPRLSKSRTANPSRRNPDCRNLERRIHRAETQIVEIQNGESIASNPRLSKSRTANPSRRNPDCRNFQGRVSFPTPALSNYLALGPTPSGFAFR
ncbi:hypothetical protein SK128_019237 [Halocaridina rubra]|uniref:Uncharacterized protein n=1 Tax=Halocaridina rubra TaxID=373956 RepID=A0AAN8WL85_HALRR